MEKAVSDTAASQDDQMTLTLVTLNGEQKVERVPSDATVDVLRQLVHDLSGESGFEYPEPEKQRVVFKGREINDCTLKDAGIKDGSSFVVVKKRTLVDESNPKPVIEKSPSKELIDSTTRKLAEQKGNLVNRSSSGGAGGQDRSALASINDIQQLLNAITTNVSHPITGNPLWLNSDLGSSGGQSDVGTGEGDEDADDSISIEEREAAGTEQVPEANPSRLQQLVEMGFSEAIASKALILRHNNLDAAMDWILEHQDDPEAETPLTESQLQRIAISRRRQRRNRRRFRANWPHNSTPVDQDLVVQLGEMGFSENLSRFALQTFNNNMELACQWLLASADDFESEPEAENSGGQQNESSDAADNDGQDAAGASSSSDGLDSIGDTLQDSRWLQLRSLASNPTLQQERLMHAFQAMIENPREARSYLTDPEIGPILLQVQRAQRVSSGITPSTNSSTNGSAQGEDSNSQATNEDLV